MIMVVSKDGDNVGDVQEMRFRRDLYRSDGIACM